MAEQPANGPQLVPAPQPVQEPAGPVQRGQGVRGQYCYWITASDPLPETVQRLGVKLTGCTTARLLDCYAVMHDACNSERNFGDVRISCVLKHNYATTTHPQTLRCFTCYYLEHA